MGTVTAKMPTDAATVLNLGRWSEFEAELQRISGSRQKREGDSGRTFHDPLFRGLGSSEWGLETTMERSHPSERLDDTASLIRYYRCVTASKSAIETFSGRRWDKLPEPPEFEKLVRSHLSSAGWLDTLLMETPGIYEYIVYLRHHGFPSPLLDWSVSPYVAAFFAFDAPQKGANRVTICAFLRDAIGGGSNEAQLFAVGPYIRTDPRHLLQQCRYTMCVAMDADNGDYTAAHN